MDPLQLMAQALMPIADKNGQGSDMEGPYPPRPFPWEFPPSEHLSPGQLEHDPSDTRPALSELEHEYDVDVWHRAGLIPDPYAMSPQQLRRLGVLGQGEQPKEVNPRGPR